MSHSRNDSEVPNPGPSDATVKLFIADFGSAELTMQDSLGGLRGPQPRPCPLGSWLQATDQSLGRTSRVPEGASPL